MNAVPEPDLLTLPEVAKMLRKTDSQMRWMIYTATGPKSALIGGRRMFRRADVLTFIDEAFEEAS